jgi:hypothetical protein
MDKAWPLLTKLNNSGPPPLNFTLNAYGHEWSRPRAPGAPWEIILMQCPPICLGMGWTSLCGYRGQLLGFRVQVEVPY